MKYQKLSITLAIIFAISFSCIRYGGDPCSANGPTIVYKTKKDYLNNVTVQLSRNGKEITGRPGSSNVESQRPIQLESGYLLKRMVGDAYLSITIEEYADTSFNLGAKELIDYVIDTDPYLEKYECCELLDPDTAFLNILIRENRLGECIVLNN